MTGFKKSGERPVDSQGRTYHNGCGFGEVSRNLIVGGARARVEQFYANYGEAGSGSRLGTSERDLPVMTMLARGDVVGHMSETIRLSMGTHGMGVGSLGTTFEEMLWGCGKLKCGETIDVIRAGSCGSVNPQQAPLGTTILVSHAHDEARSYPWISRDVRPVSNRDVLNALIEAAKLLSFPYAVGAEITTNCFYRGQRRSGLIQEIFPDGEGLILEDPGYTAHLRELEAASLAYSMEAAGIFRFAGAVRWQDNTPAIRAGVALAVYAQRDPDGSNSAFVDVSQKTIADDRAAKIALLAEFLLRDATAEIDRLRSGQ